MLSRFHEKLSAGVQSINLQEWTPQKKAQAVNALASEVKNAISWRIAALPAVFRAEAAITLQYCFSVASLEYRHKVWAYEYMAFSRRVGELWEGFCSAAWDHPNTSEVRRIAHPDFNLVRNVLRNRLQENIGEHGRRDELLLDVDLLFEIIGDINMNEDEVFTVSDIPHVIDFKSGFGSNEKGNMLRLQTVGRAYRVWNQNTRLMLLVRQVENNAYLGVLQRLGLWSVFTGHAAYEQISNITGTDMNLMRRNVVNWREDLSQEFLHHLANQPKDLRPYLDW